MNRIDEIRATLAATKDFAVPARVDQRMLDDIEYLLSYIDALEQMAAAFSRGAKKSDLVEPGVPDAR